MGSTLFSPCRAMGVGCHLIHHLCLLIMQYYSIGFISILDGNWFGSTARRLVPPPNVLRKQRPLRALGNSKNRTSLIGLLFVLSLFGTHQLTAQVGEICPECVANNCSYCWPEEEEGPSDTDCDGNCNGGGGGSSSLNCRAYCEYLERIGFGFASSYDVLVRLVKSPASFSYCNCDPSAEVVVRGMPLGSTGVSATAHYAGSGAVAWHASVSLTLAGLRPLTIHASESGTVFFGYPCYSGCL